MRILFVSQAYLKRELGAAKVVIELAEEMERLGWQCDLVAMPELLSAAGVNGLEASYQVLRTYLREHADEYDVVDYDHVFLPYSRSEFVPRPLFVARSVLLHREADKNPIPSGESWKSRARSLILGRRDARRYCELVRHVRICVGEADLVNVANHDDEGELVRWGVAKNRIVVLPYGLSREREISFEKISSRTPPSPKVAFVGSFDNRKGAIDFPRLVQEVTAGVPGSSFLLLGTLRSARDVLAKFPRTLRHRIQVIERYESTSLPGLLADCSVGVFPSYLESFGFGVLEMLAAALPVVAYNVPGPPMMLPPEYLVPRGDVSAMSRKVLVLLNDKGLLAAARKWAQGRSHAFSWKDIAKETSDIYLSCAHEKSKTSVP